MQVNQYQILIGTFMPLVVALVVRQSWTADMKRLIAFALCLMVGAIAAYLQGSVNPTDLFASGLVILLLAKATYDHFWSPLGVTDLIQAHTGGPPAATPS